MNKKYLLLIIPLIAVLFLLAGCNKTQTQNQYQPDTINEESQQEIPHYDPDKVQEQKKVYDAPEFEVTTIEGKVITLSSHLQETNKPLVLYFWATWCPFCKQDFENLKNIYPQYKDKVDFLAVDLDTTETIDQIKNYQQKNGYTWQFAPGNLDILQSYNIKSTTSKFGITPQQKITYLKAGVINSAEWDSLFKSLIS